MDITNNYTYFKLYEIMKILVLVRERLNGVLFYREIIPHTYMAMKHPDVEIVFRDNIYTITDEEMATFDLVHSSYFFIDELTIKRILRLGIKLIIDVDDYWQLDRFHELYNHYKEEKRGEYIQLVMGIADAITTTTEMLGQKIKQHTDNVSVLANCLIEDDYINPKPNPIPFIAWLGAANHTADLFEIQHLQKGYGIPVYVPEMYREVFGDRFLYYGGQPIPNYLGLYNQYDIIISPLRDNKFNNHKSPLKFMEAGMFKKPLIISNVDPFKPYLRHKENCLVVRKKSEWSKWAVKLSKDGDIRKELGNNLYKDVIREFDIEKITKKRLAFYKKIIGGDDSG